MSHYVKLEFIVDSHHVDAMVDQLGELDCPGYSVIELSFGKGQVQGRIVPDGITATNKFYYFIVADRKSVIDKMVKFLDPFYDEQLGLYWTTKVDKMKLPASGQKEV